jgi:spermidine synthase
VTRATRRAQAVGQNLRLAGIESWSDRCEERPVSERDGATGKTRAPGAQSPGSAGSPGSLTTPVTHLPQLDEYEGHRALMVDGVIFSVEVGEATPAFGYWAAMLPEGSPRTALLLGLGAGTLAHLLTRQCPAVRITGVEIDPGIIEFARRHFDLALPNLEVILADAFDYVARCSRQFDYVAVDLFRGAAFHRGVLARSFLRRLAAIAGPQGDIVINMYQDHRSEGYLRRIARVLDVVRAEQLPCNVLAHCRPRPSAARGQGIASG